MHVRYLANATDAWVNENRVEAIPGVDLYALVLFRGLRMVGVVRFALKHLAQVCQLLGKRHPNQGEQLQFTARNWRMIHDDPGRFPDAVISVCVPAAS